MKVNLLQNGNKIGEIEVESIKELKDKLKKLQINVDKETFVPIAVKEVNTSAKQYISTILKQLDWGDSYEEALAEIQNTATAAETEILVLLKPKIENLTLSKIREYVALYITGQKTTEEILDELKEYGFADEEIKQFFSLLETAVEAGKLIYWIEKVWRYIRDIEDKRKSVASIEEIESIISDLKFPEV